MPAVDFYILNESSKQKALLFACHFIEKNHAVSKTSYIHVPSQEEANQLDTLLWTFRDDSFLPHALYPSPTNIKTPIHIGFHSTPPIPHDVLINLSFEIPLFYKQFHFIVEIVFSDPHVQQLARERYKQYRDEGYTLQIHKLP